MRSQCSSLVRKPIRQRLGVAKLSTCSFSQQASRRPSSNKFFAFTSTSCNAQHQCQPFVNAYHCHVLASARYFCTKKPVTTSFGGTSSSNTSDSNSNSSSSSNSDTNNDSSSSSSSSSGSSEDPKIPKPDPAQQAAFAQQLRRVFVGSFFIFLLTSYATFFWSKSKLNKIAVRRKEVWQGEQGREVFASILKDCIIGNADDKVRSDVAQAFGMDESRFSEIFFDLGELEVRLSTYGAYEVIVPIFDSKNAGRNRILGELHVKMGVKEMYDYGAIMQANNNVNVDDIFDGYDYLAIEVHPKESSRKDSKGREALFQPGPIPLYVNKEMHQQAVDFAHKHGLAPRNAGGRGVKRNEDNRQLMMSLLGYRDSMIREFSLPFAKVNFRQAMLLTPKVFYESMGGNDDGQNFQENSGFRLLLEFPLFDEKSSGNASNQVLIFDMIKLDVNENGFNVVAEEKKNQNYGRGCLFVGLKNKNSMNNESSIDEEILRFENWEGGDKIINDGNRNEKVAKKLYQALYSSQFVRTDV